VHRGLARTTVAVIEGRVRVSAAAARLPHGTLLDAGQGLSIDVAGAISAPAPVDVEDATAWRERRLVFRRHTLGEMAAEFNRYNKSPRIRIEDEALRQRQFNGVFDADDPQSLLRFLQDIDGLSTQQQRNEIIVRRTR